MTSNRDHGGDLDRAIQIFGGGSQDWLDLSTGINPTPYPVPQLPSRAWATLPTAADVAGLVNVAQNTYGGTFQPVALAGAQAAIQLIPRLATPGQARVLAPTYNEHAAALTAAGWTVTEVGTLKDLAGAELAVVVNPNNPDGRCHTPNALLDLRGQVGRLVVDESFGDVTPEASVVRRAGPGLLVLRSFGKFYGLAGLRLGFVFCGPPDAARLREMAGPWSVSGPAISIGQEALADHAWARATRARLTRDANRLDQLAAQAGWTLIGGCSLFRTYQVAHAGDIQSQLARHHVWTRIFPYAPTWIRLGLPAQDRWDQLEKALR